MHEALKIRGLRDSTKFGDSGDDPEPIISRVIIFFRLSSESSFFPFCTVYGLGHIRNLILPLLLPASNDEHCRWWVSGFSGRSQYCGHVYPTQFWHSGPFPTEFGYRQQSICHLAGFPDKSSRESYAGCPERLIPKFVCSKRPRRREGHSTAGTITCTNRPSRRSQNARTVRVSALMHHIRITLRKVRGAHWVLSNRTARPAHILSGPFLLPNPLFPVLNSGKAHQLYPLIQSLSCSLQ